MFEFGFAKLALIALVALIVVGPTRLPCIARTVGTLLGHAQCYLNALKNEVNHEIETEALQHVRAEFEQSAQYFARTFHEPLYPAGSALPSTQPARRIHTSCKRSHWRVKRNVQPLWYKHVMAHHRAYVQSGAARIMRYGSARRQKPIRFF